MVAQMFSSTSDAAEQRLSGRLAYLIACGAALLYSCSLLAANVFPIFPRQAQEHGWPCIYMVREWRVHGPMSIFYGPWPFDAPPLDHFWPTAVAINAVVGVILVFCAAVIVVYWFRARQKAPQFSVLTMLEALTGVSIWLAWFADALEPRELPWFALGVVQRGIYVVPCLLIVTLAHWLLRPDGPSWAKWRCRGIHWMSWLTLAVLAAPTLHHGCLAHTGFTYTTGEGGVGATSLASYGWPCEYTANRKSPHPLWCSEDGSPIRHLNLHALALNLVVASAFITAPVFVVERWIRRIQRQAPMARGTLLAVFIVAALVGHILRRDQAFRPAWYVYPFWLCGMSGTIFLAIVLVAHSVSIVVSCSNKVGGCPDPATVKNRNEGQSNPEKGQ